MKRFAALMVVASVMAGVISMPGARAGHRDGDCEIPAGGIGFQYCQEHPYLSALPLNFKVNVGSKPANISQLKVVDAVNLAMLEWNRYWPVVKGNVLCGEALCNAGTTSTATAAPDSVNAIFWSASLSFPGCANDTGGGVAIACVWYDPANRHRIIGVDIALNINKSWWQPAVISEPIQVVAGEVAGSTYPELGNNDAYNSIGQGAGKYDLQSVLTHELGHALGLEDIGSESSPWPGSLTDTGNHTQTMYRWYYEGTANKRTLDWGDIAGLQRVAADVAVHRG